MENLAVIYIIGVLTTPVIMARCHYLYNKEEYKALAKDVNAGDSGAIFLVVLVVGLWFLTIPLFLIGAFTVLFFEGVRRLYKFLLPKV